MNHPPIRPSLSILLVATCLGHLPAQDPDKKGPDKEVADKVEVLKDVVLDKKCARDAEGVEILDFLIQKQEAGMFEKDAEMVVKALDDVLHKGKLRAHDEASLYTAAVLALGRHGPEGAKVLQKAYDKTRFKRVREWVPLRENILVNLGRTKDEAMVKFLLDEATRSPEAALQAAAGEALGCFEEAKEPIRKEIVGTLLVKWGSLVEQASQLNNSQNTSIAQDRLATLKDKWNETMKKLTRQSFDQFSDWQSWHNKNKSKPW